MLRVFFVTAVGTAWLLGLSQVSVLTRKAGNPMRVSVFALLFLSLFPANVSRAQQIPETRLEHTQGVSLEQDAPSMDQVPLAKKSDA